MLKTSMLSSQAVFGLLHTQERIILGAVVPKTELSAYSVQLYMAM